MFYATFDKMLHQEIPLEELIQCHRLIDGGHSMAEYHDPLVIFLYVLTTCSEICTSKVESFAILLRELLTAKVLVTLPIN